MQHSLSQRRTAGGRGAAVSYSPTMRLRAMACCSSLDGVHVYTRTHHQTRAVGRARDSANREHRTYHQSPVALPVALTQCSWHVVQSPSLSR